VKRGWAYFRVDLGLTDSLFDCMVDAGRTTGGRKVLIFVFVLASEDENSKVECVMDVLKALLRVLV